MATRTEQFLLSQDSTFKGRVSVAAFTKAVTIASESSAGLNPPRKALASRVLRNPQEEAVNLGFVVVRDSTIAAKNPLTNLDVTDAEIDSALSDAVWDGYAEAFG